MHCIRIFDSQMVHKALSQALNYSVWYINYWLY